MPKVNIRGFSTPLIIGAGIFVATTGLLMFFVTRDPFRFAHELMGICFAVAIVLHITGNWRPFKRYFTQNRAILIILIGLLIGMSLVGISAFREDADIEEIVIEHIEQTSIRALAPAVGIHPNVLVNRLKADGYIVEDPEMSVEQLAEKHAVDTDVILVSIFK